MADLLNSIFFALWFFLPAGLANATPIFAKKIPILNKFSTPMDFGKKIQGQRIFGDNKTWRGLLLGVIIATLTLLIQKIIYNQSPNLQNYLGLDYNNISIWLGVLMGAGALLGDATESFIKRQINISPGKSWFPFDQLDYIIGAIIFSSFIITLTITNYVIIIVVWFLLHLISSYIGYLLGLKDQPI